jgi:hypothetical protein
VPFAFVAAPRVEKGTPSHFQYVVPVEVVERRDVAAWRLEIRDWNRTTPRGPFWFYVPRAEPLR